MYQEFFIKINFCDSKWYFWAIISVTFYPIIKSCCILSKYIFGLVHYLHQW